MENGITSITKDSQTGNPDSIKETQGNSIDITVNQTLKNSTSLSEEIKSAFLSAIGSVQSFADEGTCEDEFGISPFSMSTLSKSARIATASPSRPSFTNSTILR